MRVTESVAQSLIAEIHAADHALDVDRFLRVLTPTARLQLGSQSQLQGHSTIRAVISDLFQRVSRIDHTLKDHWLRERTIAFQADVRYTLADGRAIRLPYVDVLQLADESHVEDYRIFIDLSPLMVALATSRGTQT